MNHRQQGLLTIFCLLLSAQVLRAEPEKKPDELTKLKEERLAVAKLWYNSAMTDGWAGGGTDTHYFRDVVRAAHAVRDSTLNLAQTKKQRVEARKIAYESLAVVHEKISTLHKSGTKGGEPVHLYSSKYEMLDAKIKWLEEAQHE